MTTGDDDKTPCATTFYIHCVLMKQFNSIDICRFHLSLSRETIARVPTLRKPEDEHIFFISFRDWQIKARCQEKLSETTINELLQGAHTVTRKRARAHTHGMMYDYLEQINN